jgi:predicted ArsR family transcriptional regulator
MRARALHDRLLEALSLQPMTYADLARALSCTYSGVEHRMQVMHLDGHVRIVGRKKCQRIARPQWLWGLAKSASSASSVARAKESAHLGVGRSSTCA